MKCGRQWENQSQERLPMLGTTQEKNNKRSSLSPGSRVLRIRQGNREVLLLACYFLATPPCSSLNLSPGRERWHSHCKRLVQQQPWEAAVSVDVGSAGGISQARLLAGALDPSLVLSFLQGFTWCEILGCTWGVPNPLPGRRVRSRCVSPGTPPASGRMPGAGPGRGSILTTRPALIPRQGRQAASPPSLPREVAASFCLFILIIIFLPGSVLPQGRRRLC